MKKLHAITLLVATAGIALIATNVSAETLSGSTTINFTGSINGANTCTIAVDGGGVLDVGTNDISSLNNPLGAIVGSPKDFNATVNCTFPVATAIKFSSSLPNDPASLVKFGIVKTSTNKNAAHVYLNTTSTTPTAGGVASSYAAIGNQTISSVRAASALSNLASESEIYSVSGVSNNVLTVINRSGSPASASTFVYPFRVIIFYDPPSNGWKNDIQGTTLSLNNTMILELYTL